MEGFQKPRSEKPLDTVSVEEIEPVLHGLQEKLGEQTPEIIDEFELPAKQAEELSELLKDIQAG